LRRSELWVYRYCVMNITDHVPPWLLMVFTLPSAKASERVQVWRKLQKFGSLPFRNAGYLLPNTSENRERLVWVSETVRSHGGDASVIEVSSIDDLSEEATRELFRQSRETDYEALRKDLEKLKPRNGTSSPQALRLRKRFDEIIAMDFFVSKRRGEIQALFDQLNPLSPQAKPTKLSSKKDFQKKTWLTRPRPGIDRVSSAWLISREIDNHPTFAFAPKSEAHPGAIPFDMYGSDGFGHEGDRCTFETLCRSFSIKDKKIALIAEAIHDADLEDGKYGRQEGHVINRILQGWAKQKLEDHELLKRGMDLIEGLYVSLA
jgi:hypothetical protein